MLYKRSSTLAAVTCLLFCCGALVLSGCGGGGGSKSPSGPNTPATTRATVTVHWPARSRGRINGLSSALSLEVTLVGASSTGQDATFVLNRRAEPAAYDDTYTAPSSIVVGTWDLHCRFYALSERFGDVVGLADTRVTVAADGLLPDIATTGLIHSVEVVPSQSVLVGERKDLTFTTRNEAVSVLAVTPGSAFFTITDGSDRIRFVDGMAEGTLPGAAKVIATVDGVASAPVLVTITSNAAVSVTPNPATVAVGGTILFAATVTNAPNNNVTWTVLEGTGGSITPDGKYTAPADPGTYHLVVTSQYDPSKQTVIEIKVQAGSVGVGVTFPPTGSIHVGID